MKAAVLSALVLSVFASFASAQEKAKPPRITEANLYEMEELVAKGADPNKPIGYSRMRLVGEIEPPDEFGSYFPLDAAVKSQQPLYVERILALGAKPRGNELSDAAFGSSHSMALEVAKLLLKAGVDPNDTKHRVYGPALHAAAFRGNLKLVELLLAQPKINVNLQDIDGRTALMPASKGGHLKIVEVLLKAGADPSLKNRRGQTAADEAQAEIDRRGEIVSRLKSTVASRWTGHWKVAYSNGIDQVHEIREDSTATASADVQAYLSVGRATREGESLSITYDDKHREKWTSVGDRMIVEHWDPVSQSGKIVKVIGIGERTPQPTVAKTPAAPKPQTRLASSLLNPADPVKPLPAGNWTVQFDNGVVEACEIRKDGTAFVSEPLRSAPGRATVKGDSVVIAFEDDRIERWRPVGNQLVVEHWNPISEKGIATPALGIAERTAATR